MPDPSPSLAEQIAACRREIALRQNLYPRWIAKGRLTQAKADHELACARAWLARLEGMAAAGDTPTLKCDGELVGRSCPDQADCERYGCGVQVHKSGAYRINQRPPRPGDTTKRARAAIAKAISPQRWSNLNAGEESNLLAEAERLLAAALAVAEDGARRAAIKRCCAAVCFGCAHGWETGYDERYDSEHRHLMHKAPGAERFGHNCDAVAIRALVTEATPGEGGTTDG